MNRRINHGQARGLANQTRLVSSKSGLSGRVRSRQFREGRRRQTTRHSVASCTSELHLLLHRHVTQCRLDSRSNRFRATNGPEVHKEQARPLCKHVAVQRRDCNVVLFESGDHRIDFLCRQHKIPDCRNFARAGFLIKLPQNIGSCCKRLARINAVSLDIGCSLGVVFRAKQGPPIGVLLRLGHCHRRGTISPEKPYNRVCSLKNNSILEQLDV